MKILIVEDDQNNRDILGLVLKKQGYEIQQACNGREALEKVRLSRPDLIISDVMMPEMDGFMLCRLLKADPALKDIPFVLFTATNSEKDEETLALSMGAVRFIRKPFETRDLLAAVKEELARGAAAGPAVPPAKPGQSADSDYLSILTRKLRAKEVELEAALAKLSLSERRLKKAQALANVGNWELDLRTGEIWASEEAFSIYGLNPSTSRLPLSGAQESVLPEYRSALDQALKGLVRGEREYNEEFCIKKIDTGEIRDINSKAELVRDQENRPLMVIGVLQDVTERNLAKKKLLESEEQLRQSQKLDSMGRLAGGVAHDLNNLLGPILAYADFLKKSLPNGDQRLDDIAEIVKAADQAAALVKKLLAFSRKQVMELKVIDVNVVVSEMERMLKRVIGENVRLDSVLGPAAGPVRVDPGQLEQVILNLVLNARDAMPDGGDIRIETAMLDLEAQMQAPSGSVPAGRYLALSVKDNGSGMDEATQKKIFEPFFTTKGPGKGVGLGLSTVYGIVKQSGGSIMVESAPGTGSVFRICFPLAAEGVVEHARPAEPVKEMAGTGRILVVEDDEQMRKIAKRILAAAGYSVIEAADAKEALRLLAEGGQPVALMLTDMAMPGMSGVELSLAVLAKYPVVKIICMSGYLEKGEEFRELLGGKAEFIEKPFTPQVLVSKVNSLLK